MKNILTILLLLSVINIVGQARLVINQNSYLVINNGSSSTPSFVVLDNSATDALTVAGSGANLISKGEFNQLKWNVQTGTGVYSVPLTADNDVSKKIPVSVNITSAGTESGAGTGNLRFAQWAVTTPATHAPFPTGAPAPTSLGSGPGTASDLADRWWIIDAQGYSTKPTPDITFKFADIDVDVTDNPGMTVANLKAQQYDNGWNLVTYGTSNGTDEVSGITPGAGSFNRIWVLVESSTPLPIELAYFKGYCKGGKVKLAWETATELNTLKFIVQKGISIESFENIATIPAYGTSSTPKKYDFNDYFDNGNSNYYRLISEDKDGSSTIESTIFVQKCENMTTEDNLLQVTHAYNKNQIINVSINGTQSDNITALVYDAMGRVVEKDNLVTFEGENNLSLDLTGIANGIYFLYMEGENGAYTKKFYLSDK